MISKIHFTLVSGVVLLAGPAVESFAQPNWPHLRGPNYDAVSTETGLVDHWPPGGPPVLWSIELGQGYSGFVVGNGRLFTQCQSKTSQFIVALNPDSGEEIWGTRIGPPWQPFGAYPGPYATPTWSNNRVYFTTPLGKAGCLDAADGHEIWSLNLRQQFGLRGVDFGYAATPLIEDGKMILPVGGPNASVVALNVADGSTVWAAGDDLASYCPAYPITLDGRRAIVAYLQNALVIRDLATGEQLWRQRLSDQYDEHSAWPLFADPYLLVAAPFKHGARAFRLEAADNKIAAKTIWDGKPLSNDVSSSVLIGGHVYGFDLHQAQSSPNRASRGIFKCLDLKTGATKWETDQVGQATVLCAEGKLILLDDTGTLILAQASPDAYEELARAKVLADGICWTQPTLWNGRLFVRNQTRAVCLFLGTETVLDSKQPIVRSAPTKNRLDWSGLLPREPEFPHDAPLRSEVIRWFVWCVAGAFVPAALFAAAIARLGARSASKGAFLILSFALGAVGTTIFSDWADTFILTWPASLYVAFRAMLALAVRREKQSRTLLIRLRSTAALALFLAICAGYYKLCAAIDFPIGWCFLIGFVPAAPASALAAKQKRWWLRWLLDALGFAIFFFFGGLLPEWKSGGL